MARHIYLGVAGCERNYIDLDWLGAWTAIRRETVLRMRRECKLPYKVIAAHMDVSPARAQQIYADAVRELTQDHVSAVRRQLMKAIELEADEVVDARELLPYFHFLRELADGTT